MQDGNVKADLSGEQLTEANLVFYSMGATNNNHHYEESAHA
jgi:hypothetical protein